MSQDDGSVDIPIEDIAWIVLDTEQTSLTGAVLSNLAKAGVLVVICDSRHMPCGVVLPDHGHHLRAEVATTQVQMSEPLKKRLWQAIVIGKIRNQAAVLSRRSATAGDALWAMARRVRSGDPDNVEARAARYYWSSLFDDFRRSDEHDRRNRLLDYGYAIIRGAIARALVASGFVPALGLQHSSRTNSFNLADDLVEPFRPFVDQMVDDLAGSSETRGDQLTVDDRRALATVLLENAAMGDEKVSLLVAAEMTAAALWRSIDAKDPTRIILPRVIHPETGRHHED